MLDVTKGKHSRRSDVQFSAAGTCLKMREWLWKPWCKHTCSAGATSSDEVAATEDLLRAVKAHPPFHRLGVEFRSGEALEKKHRAATSLSKS